jgi:hypothetical protein
MVSNARSQNFGLSIVQAKHQTSLIPRFRHLLAQAIKSTGGKSGRGQGWRRPKNAAGAMSADLDTCA